MKNLIITFLLCFLFIGNKVFAQDSLFIILKEKDKKTLRVSKLYLYDSKYLDTTKNISIYSMYDVKNFNLKFFIEQESLNYKKINISELQKYKVIGSKDINKDLRKIDLEAKKLTLEESMKQELEKGSHYVSPIYIKKTEYFSLKKLYLVIVDNKNGVAELVPVKLLPTAL